jgi:hypothetical protein
MTVNISYFAGAGWQFFDNNGVPLTGGLLYTYTAGTTTPQTTYTTNAGSIANSNPIILDSAGRTPNEIWLTSGVNYKFVLKDSSGAQIGSWDNIPGMNDFSAFSNTSNINEGDALIGFKQADYANFLSGATARTVHSKFTEMISVWDFMTSAQIADVQSGAGTIDVRAACQSAINAAKNLGAAVHFPSGVYLINSTTGPDSKNNGLVIPYTNANSTSNRVKLVGDGSSTVLKAGSNNMIVVRWSDSHCEMDGFSIDANGKTTVWGLGLVPEDMNQTTSYVFQLYNAFRNLYILNCDEGIVLRCGPDVGGTDSGCWYNDISSTFIYSCKRGVWLMDCPSGSSGSNRNYFHQMRIGQVTNTGIQIDDGGTNVFTEVHLEGILTGTSPNTTPTAIKIKKTGASGSDNNTNIFYGCMLEANTRSLENANSYSEFYGCSFGYPYTMVLTENPKVMIGDDPSICPQFVPGFLYQANGQIAGKPNLTIWPTFKIRSSDDYFTDYQKLIGVTVGSIDAGQSATVTIYPVQASDQQVTIQFVVTAWEKTPTLPLTLNATDTATGQILAQWQGGLICNAGLSTVTYAQSQGIADYRVPTSMTVTITTSSNNLQMTIANGGTDDMRRVRIGMIVTTS